MMGSLPHYPRLLQCSIFSQCNATSMNVITIQFVYCCPSLATDIKAAFASAPASVFALLPFLPPKAVPSLFSTFPLGVLQDNKR